MGEEEDKKVDQRAGGGRKPPYRRNNRAGNQQPKTEKYTAPTPGLENYVWTMGSANDAANYTKVRDALVKYIGGSALYKHGTKYAMTALTKLTNPTFTEPADPAPKSDPPTVAEIKAWTIWEAALKKHIEAQQTWEDTKVKLFGLIRQHMHPNLEDKIKTSTGWDTIEEIDNVVGLMILIRKYTHDYNEATHGTANLVKHDINFLLGFQKENESLDEFHRNFKARADVIDSFGGQSGYHPEIYKQHRQKLADSLGIGLDDLNNNQKKKCLESAREEYKAALFIIIANKKRHKSAKNKLDNDHLTGSGAYPNTVEGAVNFLENYKADQPSTNRPGRGNESSGVVFSETGDQQGSGTVCYGCGRTGHPLKYCRSTSRDKKNEIYQAIKDGTFQEGQNHAEVVDANKEMKDVMDGVANVQLSLDDADIVSIEGDMEDEVTDSFGFMEPSCRQVYLDSGATSNIMSSKYVTATKHLLTTEVVGFIEPTSRVSNRLSCGENKLFLDSCATNHTMCSKNRLTRIHMTKHYLRQNCNAGSKLTNVQGYWQGIPFWYNSTGIANLLSLPKLEKSGWIIEYKTGGTWTAMSPQGMILTFKKDKGLCDGMLYLDMDKIEEHITFASKEDVVLIETVRKNMEGFTLEEVKRATKARDAMAMMAHPPLEKLKHLVSRTNHLGNVPFTADDLTNSNLIYGPDRGAIRGKTVRQKPSRVRPTYVQIPLQLYEKLRDVTLTADVMFVNSLPFFITVSRRIKLITVQFLPSRTAEQLCNKLRTIMHLYRRGGYLVRTALMDMEFKPLVDMMDDVNINTTAAREHVGDVERCIRLIKDRCRSVIAELPYKDFLPDQFVIHLLYFVTRWLNTIPNDNGISKEYSPRELLDGTKLSFEKHCKAKFGAYVEASADRDITNDMNSRTDPCIVLGPTGNIQGSVNCYNLATKKVVERHTITPLPMPDRVVRRVIAIGKKAKQTRTSKRLQFLNRHKEEFAWDNDDELAGQGLLEDEPHETHQLPAEIPGVMLESDVVDDEAAIERHVPSDLELATAALANANLAPISDKDQIAGVDSDPRDVPDIPIITDDEDNADEDEQQDDEDENDVEFMGENLQNGVENEDIVNLTDEHTDGMTNQETPGVDVENDADDEDSESDDEEESEEEDVGRRYPRRIRKKTESLTIDDPRSKSYTQRVRDGVLHLSPAVEEQSREDLKITSKDIFVRRGNDKVGLTVPRTAGITQAALTKFNVKALNLGSPEMPDIPEEDGLVNDSVVMHVLGVVLAEQYSINKGIRLFGDRARESIKKELRQLHDYVTYIPVRPEDLTPEQRKQALASLIFITEKRCGRVKTRACVNGSTQRDYIPKESTASPTVMNDSVQITSAIDAHEGRVVVSCDIPGAFLHADLDEEVFMLLRGQLADLMVSVDPALYGPYMRKTKKGESMMYVKMKKAMYGLLRSALLFYLRLVKDLQEFGFKLNPYDPCVANKVVDGSQMTVVWHVDDLKISHMQRSKIDGLLAFLKGKYGEGIVVHEGPIQDYLGVDHDYGEKGVVKMSMMKHIKKIFEDFPDEIGKDASSPASDHLFQVRDPDECEKEGKYLSDEKKKAFHHSVAQLLFVATRVRRDIQTAVAFLTTRVKKPDEDDWGKLKRVLKYLKGTLHMKLRLTVENLGIIRWWVDASYNVHDDCKGQTGAMMSLGQGAPISFSRKQKLNVRSSTEGELVGIDDALPYILWARYFIEAQGYTVEQNILYQDNKSTILLANNGRWSSSKRTRHIKSRYFFIKDKVDSGEISVEHKPTNEMWSDTLTKPKQGKGMRVDRAMLMGCEEDYDDEKERLKTDPLLLPKEETDITINTQNSHLELDRRSVLGKVDKAPMTVWNTSSNRVDENNVKARRR